MPRPFRVLAIGVVLLLATLGTAAPASADEPAPPLPDSMAAIGGHPGRPHLGRIVVGVVTPVAAEFASEGRTG